MTVIKSAVPAKSGIAPKAAGSAHLIRSQRRLRRPVQAEEEVPGERDLGEKAQRFEQQGEDDPDRRQDGDASRPAIMIQVEDPLDLAWRARSLEGDQPARMRTDRASAPAIDDDGQSAAGDPLEAGIGLGHLADHLR